ncbi:MAG: SpoIID/LytB domain-containing protein [Spirochaetaceae bacterium]|nr:SpoIID/LytB domain-containing protein [Spirochaetaceae bacterium]
MISNKNYISSLKIKKYPINIIAMFFISFSILILAGFSGCETTENKNTKNNLLNIHDDQDKMMNAIMTYYKGNIELSIKLFKNILEKEPKNRKAFLSLVRLLEETGEYEEAAIVLSKYNIVYDPLLPNENPLLAGALWEDKSIPFFLIGNYEKYLNEATIYSNNTYDSFLLNQIQNDIKSENLFFTGWAYKNLGITDKASESFIAAIEIRKYFPVAHLMLGEIYYNKGNFSAAEKQFSEALRLDFNLTQGRFFLAKSLIALGKLDEGYSALKRTSAIRPWDKETKKYILEFENKYPSIVEQRKEEEKKKREILTAPVAKTFTVNPSVMPEVRVGLGENLAEFFLKTGGNFFIKDNSENTIVSGGKDSILKLKYKNNIVEINDKNEKNIAKLNDRFTISFDSEKTTTIIFNVSHSTGYQTAGQEDRAYRGRLLFIPVSGSGITIINILPLEEYLYSVVPSEMPSTWPDEAIAAQAIAARSYTLANMGRFKAKGYDVSGSIISAFYRGYTGETEKTTKAVEKTRGLVLKYDNKYVSTFYSANSAGRTESARSVWNMNAPIIGVTDPQLVFETDPPSPDELTRWILSEPLTYSSVPKYFFRSSYRWRLIVPREEIEARIGKDIGTITSITTLGRGNSGRVEKVLVKATKKNEVISNDSIRSSLGGLRSNLFIIMPKLGENGIPEYFIFAGGGWGHGVGMCQTGAAGMAHNGFSSSEILKHYYPLAELVSEYQ